MSTEVSLHPASLLAQLCRQEALTTANGKPFLRQVAFPQREDATGRLRSTTATLVSIDTGNDAFKGAMLHAHQPILRTRRIITAYAPASILRAGEGVATWQVDESEPFWLGEDALLSARAESLPIGTSEERLPDARYRHFLFACLVELLREAGYETPARDWQGEHDLYLSIGLPNEEMTRGGVKDLVQRALQTLYNVPQLVRRTDEQGRVTTWKVRIVELSPYPQTFGSFVTWYYTLDGTAVDTDIVKQVTLDIGGGQFHSCTVTLAQHAEGRPRLRMEAQLLDEGTIALARAVRESLRSQHPGIRLSDAEAQQVLVSGSVVLGGRRTPVNDLVADVIATRSQKMLTHLRHVLQEDHSFLLFTGGGSVLLERSLHQLVSARRNAQSFLFVPKELASVLNAIGGYVLAQTAAQRRMQTAAGAQGSRP